MSQEKDIQHRFSFHSAAGDAAKQKAHEDIRDTCGSLGLFLDAVLPNGREKSTAITKIEEAMFWANAAVAREVKS